MSEVLAAGDRAASLISTLHSLVDEAVWAPQFRVNEVHVAGPDRHAQMREAFEMTHKTALAVEAFSTALQRVEPGSEEISSMNINYLPSTDLMQTPVIGGLLCMYRVYLIRKLRDRVVERLTVYDEDWRSRYSRQEQSRRRRH